MSIEQIRNIAQSLAEARVEHYQAARQLTEASARNQRAYLLVESLRKALNDAIEELAEEQTR